MAAGPILAVGFFSGLVCMSLYEKLARHERIRATKQAVADTRRVLMEYDGEFSGMAALMKDHFRQLFRLIGLTGWPTLIALAPLIALLEWIDAHAAALFPVPLPFPFLPDWLRGWESPFLAGLAVGALVIKVIRGKHEH